jgi:pyruvate formate-lyase activating enzyme-like uncharacterized protein
MISKITPEVLAQISNPVFRDNARMYREIESNYLEQVGALGLPFANSDDASATERLALTDPANPKRAALIEKGLVVANDAKSLHLNWISPACETCRKGIGSITFTISMCCPRNCLFCFNPNQDNYERLQHEMNDPAAELRELHRQNVLLSDIALTGGEPLMHKKETEKFFVTARDLFPDAYTRLYTSGAFLDKDYLSRLAKADVSEIRFSLKTDDSPAVLQETLDIIELSRGYLEQVMVEMPVLPDEFEVMCDLLLSLDKIGIDGINLLELCFPFNNVSEFQRRGYKLKKEPLRVLYNYWYGGGLPIAGSEEVCLDLLAFAVERDLTMGTHYCSLENKLSGQIYQQNAPVQKDYPYCSFSKRDYFFKSAKIYGQDAARVVKTLTKRGQKKFRYDENIKVLEFSPTYLESLASLYPDIETAISYHVVEQDEQGTALRELRLDLTTPATFNAGHDI